MATLNIGSMIFKYWRIFINEAGLWYWSLLHSESTLENLPCLLQKKTMEINSTWFVIIL